MLPGSPNGRTNIGTVTLDANELRFAADGSLTIALSHEQPTDATARANWLPAPEGQFALIVRAYVPSRRSSMAGTSFRMSRGSTPSARTDTESTPEPAGPARRARMASARDRPLTF